MGSFHGAYNTLTTMVDKLDSQLELAQKLRAVDAKQVALKILNSHFMKDIVGNLRAFTSQTFRCTKCNRKYRRPPLAGKCQRCGGPIQMTVHKGGIEKYLKPALDMVKKYGLDQYYVDRLELVQLELSQIFVEEAVPEETLEAVQPNRLHAGRGGEEGCTVTLLGGIARIWVDHL